MGEELSKEEEEIIPKKSKKYSKKHKIQAVKYAKLHGITNASLKFAIDYQNIYR